MDIVETFLAGEAAHGGVEGNDDLVVGVEPALITFDFGYADNQVIGAFDFDLFANGVGFGVAEEICDDLWAENGDFGALFDFHFREGAAAFDFEIPNFKEGGWCADDGGVGIVAEIFYLEAGGYFGGGHNDFGEFVEDGFGVFEGEITSLASADNTAASSPFGADGQEVAAHASDGFGDFFFGAGAKGQHGNDGGNADDYAQHG